jgi:hypothetical protein
MDIKPGASLAGLDIRMRPALIVANKVYADHGKKLVITCGTDGSHSAGSYHYYGLAIDCRTNYFSEAEIHSVAAAIRNDLSAPFDVVVEKTHLHIEYDIEKDDSLYASICRLIGKTT